MMLTRILAWCGAALLLASCTSVDPRFEKGQVAYGEGSYEEARLLWHEAATDGDADSAHALGRMYAQGHGVKPDLQAAAEWYRRAADEGHAQAQLDLGELYDGGRGVARDYEQAARFYAKAADQGLSQAQNNLGRMYKAGEGVPRSYADAARWFTRAAWQGHPAAQNSLGLMYITGHGVTQDPREAYFWIALACRGESKAEENLAFVRTLLSEQQRTEIDRRVAAWRAER
jgi:hypothetical protein